MSRRTLRDRRAVVTGASSGIGRAVCLELARRGARVAMMARREALLRELAEEIERADGEALVVVGDVASPADRARLLEAVKRQWNGLDLLVNNAGVGALGPLLEAEPARLRRIMEVNFFAAAELLREAAPLLREGTDPLVVNVGSVLGHVAVPDKVEYCASKFALRGLSEAVRAELAEAGIGLLLVSPSTTETEFFERSEGELAGDHLRGAMPAAAVARRIVRAIERREREIVLSWGGQLLVLAGRFFPRMTSRLIARWRGKTRR